MNRPGLRRGLTFLANLWIVLFATATIHGVCAQSVSQEADGTITLVFRGTPLSLALEAFATATGESLAYETYLVAGHSAYCVLERASSDQALRCILRNTGLDFFRLSSGTVVLAGSAEQSPLYGYITGIVRDDATGRPLPEANVQLVGLAVGAATTAGGTFVLPPILPGTYEIRITHVSYYTWQGELDVEPGGATPTAVRLAPRSVPVGPVVVDGTSGRLLSQELASPSVDAGPPDVTPALDVYRSASQLAGVRINDVTADLYVDGSAPGDTRLFIDGAPLFLPRQSIGLIGPFSALAFDRLTVHRAGFGVVPGSMIGGIVEARHGLNSPWSHLQLDPSGLNARLKFGGSESGSKLSTMVAGRVGSWDVYAPARYSDVLSQWTAADPFLIVAPLRRYEYATDEFVADTLGLLPTPSPTVTYSDLHAAFNYQPSLLRTLEGSIYRGTQRLLGGRERQEATGNVADPQSATAFSAADDYRWDNVAGQITYSAFVGTRTLVTTQVFGSSYRLRHGYDLVDDLRLPVAFEGLDMGPARSSISLPIRDRNTMESAGMRIGLDYVLGSHQVTAGTETQVQSSETNLRSYAPELVILDDVAPTNSLSVTSSAGRYSSTTTTVAAFLEDRVALSEAVSLIGGVRTTFVDSRRTVYAEPRIALHLDREAATAGRFGARVAAGVYRQFETQVDMSTLNAGSLLPTVRLWLPIDSSVRPPISYHLAGSASYQADRRWTFSANAFTRVFQDALVFNYGREDVNAFGNQSEFLVPEDGRTIGFDGEVSHTATRYAIALRYAHVSTRRRSPSLFDRRTVGLPDEIPHRISAEVTATPMPFLLVHLNWISGWSRTWAYTRAYYDYFGHNDALRVHDGIDFGKPDTHRLPPIHRLDAGAAVFQNVGPASVQLRTDILNVFDRANVASYRLVYRDGALTGVPRPLPPRLVTVSLRASWRF